MNHFQQLLFLAEPIIDGLIFFPIVVLFWQCEWNLVLIIFASDTVLKKLHDSLILIITYSIAQSFLLCFHLGQDFFYNFLTKQNSIIRVTLLKCHIFVLASIYITQWVVIYEIILSNLLIIIWRGCYNFLDRYFYPDDVIRSAYMSLIVGYILYFSLMYFQTQVHQNIQHLLAFISCVFLWRGFWLLYDTYIDIFEYYYQTYLLLYVLSFLLLALIQTASSINGPTSSIEDECRSFYSNYYILTFIRKFF